jgi:hypothetical protein
MFWTINFGRKADRFEIEIKDTEISKVIYKNRYIDGKNVSYDKNLADVNKLTIFNLINGLIEEYGVDDVINLPGTSATMKEVRDFVFEQLG